MPASGLLALIDDVAAIADDVATLTVSAAKKSTGLVTDDMAVTAEQALGFAREREIPVVLKVAKGSLINKTLILAPAALLLNWVAPWIIEPILMCGGLFLCYEGVHKVMHSVLPHDEHHDEEHGPHGHDGKPIDTTGLSDGARDLIAFENERVSGAIRTDLILSAEIVALTLGQVATERFAVQVSVLYAVSIIITVGVFGMVGGLVKLDDFGVWLTQRGGGLAKLGVGIVRGAPMLLKAIGIIGTVAMLMVGGHILLAGIEPLYDWVHHITEGVHHPVAHYFAGAFFDILNGCIFGLFAVGVMATGIPATLWRSLPIGKKTPDASA